MGVQEIADQLKDRVAASGFDKSIKFDTGGDGVLVINGTSVSTEDAPADCTIKLTLSDLEALVAGKLNATMAFMQGKLKLEGDMAVAMALGKVLKP
ncbi:SCP2 sterol-binding domain-containing protein [Catelliglobosispora koreensis]|uniref:SCP2 sterol-binding domain-containing protein n=1 Tax=Catelliglobosispora koreensis TaxID=129052 RepID=UPI0003763C28|nr:SCP2 sterol-binding domain-containing protein [Catelliglobosispora koreensis]